MNVHQTIDIPPRWAYEMEVRRRSLRRTLPSKFQCLYQPARWKVFWGGRGSAKSWSFARTLIDRAMLYPIRVLCVREFQSSIKDSVHALLRSQIERNGFGSQFDITDRSIVSSSSSVATRGGMRAEFIFDGLHSNADQIKSKEGIDVCWVEEAHSVTEESWKYLIPTIRKEGMYSWLPKSEIWVSYNQHDESDPTHQRLVMRALKNAFVVPVTWEDNPYFPQVLDDERRYMQEIDPDAYEWVWGTSCRRIGSSIIFSGHCTYEAFDDPPEIQPLYGLDFGFSNDPNHLIRSYITTGDDGDHLWISHEAVGLGVELDDIPALLKGGKSIDGTREWEGVPGVGTWPIKADGSRPETISYLNRQGLQVRAAEKWAGCVPDGIAHLKRFRKIHIHERCKHLARESRLYAHKVDAKTGDVLPTIVDRHNHGWDASRYALDGYIQHAGGLGVWAKWADLQ